MSVPLERMDARTAWKTAMVIALLVLGTYLFASSRTTLWDRDEPWYARTAVEMVESGNYLVPTFNGKMWTDKPILFYWLMSIPLRLLGPTELACRLWSGIGIALTCLLTFAVGKQLVGPRVGLWAMLILASSLLVLGTGTLAIIDGTVLPMAATAMLVFIHAMIRGPRAWHLVPMGIALGLGMLAKGPIGLLPIPAMAVALYASRGTGLPLRRHLWTILGAMAVGIAIFLAWAIPVSKATQGEFLRVFAGREVLGRALRPMQHHGGSFLAYLPYYLVVTVAGFFPWTLHLPGALSALFGNRVAGQRTGALLIGWIVPIPMLMTLAATKLPHYILPIWPGLALITAATLVASEQDGLNARDRLWLHRGVWFFCPLAVAAATALIVGPWLLRIPGLYWSGLCSGVILAATAVIAIRAQLADRFLGSAKALLAGMLVLQIPLWLGVLPAIERVKISPEIGLAVNAHAGQHVPVVNYKFREPSLYFYVGRPMETLASEQAVVDWAGQPGPGVIIIPRQELDDIEQRHGTLTLQVIASKKGINFGRVRLDEVLQGKRLEILALTRGRGR